MQLLTDPRSQAYIVYSIYDFTHIHSLTISVNLSFLRINYSNISISVLIFYHEIQMYLYFIKSYYFL